MTDTEIDATTRLKRARMRAWRRGMREMDLILGGFIDAKGRRLLETEITTFEALLDRRDQDLYAWIAGRADSEPTDSSEGERNLIAQIRAHLPA